jgi:hypothetical protein
MSVAINRAILLKTRTDPTETVDTGEAYFWLEGASLKYKDDTQATHILSTGVTPEEVQDIVGAFISSGNDRATVVYNDVANTLVISVVESNIVHQNLSGAGTNTHGQIDSHIASTSNPHSVTKSQVGLANVDNTSDADKPVSTAQATALGLKADKATTISAGSGLTGGGDLSANRTLALTSTGVTAASYGTASSVGSFTVDAFGRLSSAINVGISILSAAVTDFAATVRSTVLTGFTVGANSTILATDTILQAFGKVQGQINALTSNVLSTLLTGVSFTTQTEVAATDTLLEGIGKLQGQINLWDELIVTTALTNNSNVTLTNITDLTTTVVTGKRYRIEGFLLFRSTAATNGIAFTMGNATAVGTLGMVTSSANAGDGTSSLYSGAITAFGDLVISTAVPAANTDYILQFSGIFVCTTGGTIFPQYRSEVNGQTTTVQIGSNMIVREF